MNLTITPLEVNTMNVKEIMEYIESEFIIINNTPCNICGGSYITESSGFNIEDGTPSNVTSCVCEDCGNKKNFFFRAPIGSLNPLDVKEQLN
jgi:hypothetical protein